MAESACQALGLELASRAQVEKARGYGYETCSYGWVLEQFGVIPRIQNNPNCGKNKTGVLTWTVHYSKPFNAYCFNGSDIRINSCKPELMVTQQPSTVVVPTSASTMASTMASTSLRTEPETTPALTSKPYVRTSPKALTTQTATTRTTTMTTSEPTTTTAKTPIPTTLLATTIENTESPKNQNQMSQKSERIVFGGLPTTLLTLALLFFIAAVALAVCYIKKYKTHLLFTKKKTEKESVETKVFNAKEEESFPNGKEAENPQKNAGSSVEAEV
ncbi:hypothetical protein GDO81_022148 [Engystomops pustulosus]|uniref:Link domain-containing protein n=1 Tax=Engystomops pustulosus TaxID=76066 RepID=A0AAV6YNC3_ENGPU|nr:hypothetical protein GDO81_022148 [Engystomops pustulosus]